MAVLFVLISIITLVSAFIVVTNRNLFHAALAMMASFLGVAGLYVLLSMGFMAAAQLLVYIGAISILVMFAIMMTRRMMQTRETPFNAQWRWGLVTSLFIFGLFAYVILQIWPLTDTSMAVSSDAALSGMVVEMGEALVSADMFVLPFEVASVLLLAALIGAIVIALPEKR
jgi:NADH-quinone oxidoreductase subunit J